MAGYTNLLNLYFKNPLTDGADNFNIETMLNENWRKIDKALGPLLPLSILPAKSVTYETGAATLSTEESAPINFVLELAVEPVADVGAITLVVFRAPNWPSATNGLILRYPSAATGEMVDEAYTFTDSGGNAINVDSFANGSLLSVALYPLLKKAYLVNPSITGRAKSRFEGIESELANLNNEIVDILDSINANDMRISGYYSGNNASDRAISIGTNVCLLIILGKASHSYYEDLMLIVNPKQINSTKTNKGFQMTEMHTSNQDWGGASAELQSSTLTLMGGSDRIGFNKTGCTYYYWGLKQS